jgi:pimeloyl-ACP methyl ester carboxylesterase
MAFLRHGVGLAGFLSVLAYAGCATNPPAGAVASVATEAANAYEFTRSAIPQQVPAQEGSVDVGGARLMYWDTGGAGEVVVLLHPGTANAGAWVYQQPVLAKAGYRVIAYSRRGHGGSDRGAPGNSRSAADDLFAVLSHLKVNTFHAVGVAAGGIYAADFALANPARLRSLTIGGSIVAVGDAEYMKRSSALRPKGFDDMPSEFRELGAQYRAGDPDGVARWKAVEHSNEIDPAATPSTRQPMKNKVTRAALKSLPMPVLLMTGDADLYLPPVLLLELANSFSNARTQVIKGAGHSAHWEQPTAFNNILVEFLNSNRRP